ncbi:MAG: ComEC/Rec2 family competence protein [Verrucomicrobia bacterium]|nr:ComEC/Rec2 family competence protein [Verrucomicrobiota bacterium]
MPLPLLLGGAATAAGIALAAGARGWKAGWAVAIVTALFLAGWARLALLPVQPAEWSRLPPREAWVTLRVERRFGTRDPRRASGLGRVEAMEAPVKDLVGQRVQYGVRLAPGEPVPLRGGVIRIRGVLAALPSDPPAGSFDAYLAAAGATFRITRGRLLAEVSPAPRYERWCAARLDRLSAALGRGVESKRPRQVAIFRAMLLGQQQALAEDQATAFRQTGTMHVFSISGLHITVIAGSLTALLALLRLPRWPRLIIGLTVLWLYVDITGTAPSAIRAFAMVAFVQVSLALRVPRQPLPALTVAALIVLLVAPADLFSASFQMSYAIVLALLLLGLPLAERWLEASDLFADLPRVSWRWHHRLRRWLWRGLVGAVAIGASTSLVGAFTGIAFFHLLTPGALLANLWLVPASSLVIVLGAVALLCSVVGFAAGTVLANHAAVLVLWGIERGIGFMQQLPGMWLPATFRYEWLGPAALSLLLAVLVAGYQARWQGWCRGGWPPFALVALLLGLGVRLG